MGSDARATCKCGYEETFLIGGGMRDFSDHKPVVFKMNVVADDDFVVVP